MTYYVEIRAGVRRAGPPKLVPLSEVDQHTGFRSAFAFDETLADYIREQGTTSNLRGQPVYADELFLDFDGHDPAQFREWLHGTDLAYCEYNSGGRSAHFHIPLVPIYGAWVPQAVKAWVRKVAPTADTSFYHPAGMYRLVGTYHSKHAGRRKEVIDCRMGEPLLLTDTQQVNLTDLVLAGSGDAAELFSLLTQAKGEGGRRPHIWKLATLAAEIGMSFDEALEHVVWWNCSFCLPPHDHETLVRQCESAFRRLARREA